MKGPRFSDIDLWGRFEQRCVDIVVSALGDLAARVGLPEHEDDLNRELYFRMRAEVIRMSRLSGAPQDLPTYEGRNPPSPTDAERAEREGKRPDFYWELVDPYEPDDDAASMTFVVECKRLTPIDKRKWVHTTEYVESGVRRFVEVGHGYGMHAPSGLMVGYLQTISLDDAIAAVNAAAGAASMPPLGRVGGGSSPATLSHVLTRQFPKSPYRLEHLWMSVDCVSAGTRSAAGPSVP